MPAISESNDVSVTDSRILTAGGNVNNVEVNVKFSGQPSSEPASSPSSWARTFGEWLLGLSQPVSVPPSTRVLEAQAAPRLTPLIDGPISIVPLEDAHIYERLALPTVPTLQPHEIYVRQLYPSGNGYPCANPMPWGRPIQIGDIGKLGSDGFRFLQNLYTLPDDFCHGNPVPIVPTVYEAEIFVEGDTITGGVDDSEVKMADSVIDEIAIRCPEGEGAALAITSPAELRQMESNDALRAYLCQNASRLFDFLLGRHPLPEGTSIYIVTGTILSASWATATYNRPMDPSRNSLVLKRISGNGSQPPYFMWTKKGNALTRTQGRQLRDTKDQCLFLKGFLLDASPALWKARRDATKVQNARQEGPDLQSDEGTGGKDSNTSQAGGSSTTQQGIGTANSLSPAPSSSLSSSRDLNGIIVHSIPPDRGIISDYPSYRINNALLDITDADFALTHDDDWREAVVNVANGPAADRNHSSALAKKVKDIMPGYVAVHNGVAFMTDHATNHIPVATSTAIQATDTPGPPDNFTGREYEDNVKEPARRQAYGPIEQLENVFAQSTKPLLHSSRKSTGLETPSSDQVYGPVIVAERVGNAFAGSTYGHLTTYMVEEFNVHRNIPLHPDISSHLSDYFPNSRTGDEVRILEWIDSNHPPELVLCVLGMVGVGKSTLAKHLATRLRRDHRLAAEVFLGFALPDWTPDSVVRMVSGQLCGTYPVLKRAIAEALDLDVGPSVSFETRIRRLILEPIRSLDLPHPLVVVLDALDQWAPHPILAKALGSLAMETHLIRFVVLGRPGIEAHFQNGSVRRFHLPHVSSSVMVNYFRARFNDIRWESRRKPSTETIEQLVNKADGLFIWSSTLCSLLEDELSYPYPHSTIAAILQSQQVVGDHEILADLYHAAINVRFPKPNHKAKLKVFLGAVLVLQEPLPIAAFAALVSMEVSTVRKIQADLGALQTGQEQDTQDIIYPASSNFHLSFIEYLQSLDTPSHFAFPIDTFISHFQLGKACLEELCHIASPPQSAFVSPTRKYAMKYWPTHIAHGTPSVSPTSDAEWRATPHCAILDSLVAPQWQSWASTYLEPLCTTTGQDLSVVPTPEVLSTSNGAPPRHFISRVLKPLLDAPVAAGTPYSVVAVAEVAVRLEHQNLGAWLDLGRAYNAAAESNGSNHLVENAVRACRYAAELDGNRGRQALGMLASCLWLRFSCLGLQEDLNESILLQRAVLLLTSPGHPDHASSLNNLANSLDSLYRLTGTVENLNEVIILRREALLLHPPGHPDRTSSLNNLVNSLNSHYKVTGTVESLDEVIMLHRGALSLRPPGHPDRASSLNNLANSLDSHHKLTGAAESLEEAILLNREALSLRPPGHPDRASSLNNLANSLDSHHKLTGAVESLEEAIVLHREALSLCPPGHPDRPWSLSNLAITLCSHFKLTGNVKDLDQVILYLQEAILLWPPSHPHRELAVKSLADALQVSSTHTTQQM